VVDAAGRGELSVVKSFLSLTSLFFSPVSCLFFDIEPRGD